MVSVQQISLFRLTPLALHNFYFQHKNTSSRSSKTKSLHNFPQKGQVEHNLKAISASNEVFYHQIHLTKGNINVLYVIIVICILNLFAIQNIQTILEIHIS